MCDNKKLLDTLLNKNVNDLEKSHREANVEKSIPHTSDIYKTFNIPIRFECPYLFQGYGIQGKRTNPFYKTVNSEYGWYFPNLHTVPTKYFPRQQKFTGQLSKAGPYRNYSLNTQSDEKLFSTKMAQQGNLTCRK